MGIWEDRKRELTKCYGAEWIDNVIEQEKELHVKLIDFICDNSKLSDECRWHYKKQFDLQESWEDRVGNEINKLANSVSYTDDFIDLIRREIKEAVEEIHYRPTDRCRDDFHDKGLTVSLSHNKSEVLKKRGIE